MLLCAHFMVTNNIFMIFTYKVVRLGKVKLVYIYNYVSLNYVLRAILKVEGENYG